MQIEMSSRARQDSRSRRPLPMATNAPVMMLANTDLVWRRECRRQR